MLNKKALIGTASAPPVYVDDVFSTYLYTGNSSTQTITNGIDLAGKGGLTWIKRRDSAVSHYLATTVGGTSNYLNSNTVNDYETSVTTRITSFNADGFSLGSAGSVNNSGSAFASWTFRKAPKFFDVVTWTGNGDSERQISHSLGVVPTVIIYKKTSGGGGPWSYTQWTGSTNRFLRLNETVASSFDNVTGGYISAEPSTGAATATSMTLLANGGLDLINTSGATYIAYLFASNAGGFGAAGTDNVISCGSYTGNGSSTGPSITLGYEPQYVMIKPATIVQDWFVADVMRGMPVGSGDLVLSPNLNDAETSALNYIDPTATGFNITSAGSSFNSSGETYIYMAIRRPMKPPTSGTDVFTPLIRNGTGATAVVSGVGFSPDLYIGQQRPSSSNVFWVDKLRGRAAGLKSTASVAETTSSSTSDLISFNQDGVTLGTGQNANINPGNTNSVANWFFKRATGFFDTVCYTGTGSARTIAHNLTVIPELMIVKSRSGSTDNWCVYNAANGNTKYMYLNDTLAADTFNLWNDTTPTSTVFSVSSGTQVNGSAKTFVAYLFATLAGISKVGSYTGTAAAQTINCGFTAGARFVLIKRTDSTGDWYVWDTARGIISGNDPYMLLNSTAAEVTSTDYIDPVSSGFEISSTAPAAINANGGSFIFMAIA